MKDRKLILLFYYYEAREWFLKMGGKWNCDSWVRNKNINCFNWRVASCISHTRTALELFVCNTHSLTSLPLLLKRKWTIHKLIIRYSGTCFHQVEFSFSSSFSQCDNAMPASSRWQDSHFKPLARVLATKPWKLVPLSVNPLEKKKRLSTS